MRARPQIEDKKINKGKAKYEYLKNHLLVFIMDSIKALNSFLSIIVIGFIYEISQGR